MSELMRVPFLGANDDECLVSSWAVTEGSPVEAGQLLCVLETTKTALEIYAACAGFAYPMAGRGERVSVGQPLCALAEAVQADPGALKARLANDPAAAARPAAQITKKAEILLARHGLGIVDLPPSANRITEEVVQAFLASRSVNRESKPTKYSRVGILGGASGGGAMIVIESLLRGKAQQPICIFDRDAERHGTSVMGVPVAGSIDDIEDALRAGKIEAIVIAFNRNLEERASAFEHLRARGVPFANVVDPEAQIRSEVRMGVGNVILGGTYVGAESVIGDNNFISAGVHLEHGNRLGSHCGFGPHVATSGDVTIGDRVRFGIGVFVEPCLRIGSRCVLPSGAVLTSDVPDGHVVQVSYHQRLKPI